MEVPCQIGDYTDFYAGIYHANNVGSLFRPENPLLPNYKWIPIAYHGRSSSIVVSGTSIRRPSGQTKSMDSQVPTFGPSRQLDYELEIGLYIGGSTGLSEPISIDRTEENIFGVCLLNDWSARDIQTWEYQPLGPFLAKNFATTVSPWIITLEALAPFRCPAFVRQGHDPEPLPYLSSASDQEMGGVEIFLEVALSTQEMRDSRIEPYIICRSSSRDLYWTMSQLVAHHTSNGSNLRPSDSWAAERFPVALASHWALCSNRRGWASTRCTFPMDSAALTWTMATKSLFAAAAASMAECQSDLGNVEAESRTSGVRAALRRSAFNGYSKVRTLS